MEIIGYAWEADLHCVDCTRAALRHPSRPALMTRAAYISDLPRDANGLPEVMIDRDGNQAHPVLRTDENPDGAPHCGDCRKPL